MRIRCGLASAASARSRVSPAGAAQSMATSSVMCKKKLTHEGPRCQLPSPGRISTESETFQPRVACSGPRADHRAEEEGRYFAHGERHEAATPREADPA